MEEDMDMQLRIQSVRALGKDDIGSVRKSQISNPKT